MAARPVEAGNIARNWSRAEAWVQRQTALKAANPNHKVIVDIGMESVRGIHPDEILAKLHGREALASLDGMRKADLSRVWQELRSQQDLPIGGAGGLGIIEETICWTGARHGDQDGYGLVSINPLPTTRRRQSFGPDNRQIIETYSVGPEQSPEFSPLGDATSANLYGKDAPIQTWRFTGFNDDKILALRLVKPGTTDVLYPHHESQLVLDQMQVLGQGGFRLAQKLGLLGVDKPIADLVIGHDSQTAFFKFNIFLWFYKKYGDKEAALRATKALCYETIHAPQNGTVVRTTGEMVRNHYPEEDERLYGELGLDNGRKTNTLFADMRLSGHVGVVSPIHLMVTESEEKARRRGFAADAANLLPDGVNARDLRLYPDTLDIESWLGMGTQLVMDQYMQGWRVDPSILGDQTTIDRLSCNPKFRASLAEAFSVQEQMYLGLLRDHFPRRFGADIPENAVVFASLRRATKYKINLVTEFLRQYETIEQISKNIGRPIFYLFGGFAHHEDQPSITSLSELLELIHEINQRKGAFTADFLLEHDYDKARFMFPGLSIRGAWVGATNPFDQRSQGTEAFGPSYLKALINAMYVMGTFDGGAGCLRRFPTVTNYGPALFAGGKSLHNDFWSNRAIVEMSRFLLANGFIAAFEQVATRISEDLNRYEKGQGKNAPGLGPKIRSMFPGMAEYNGRVLMASYLES